MKTKSAPKAPGVSVECVARKDQWEIKAGEVGRGDFPMCEKCYSPMIPVRAIAQLGGRR